jgi:colanic acid biosynthesis glycosyl transferase WcaI
LTQALGSALAGLLARRCDVVLVIGPPLVGPNLGALVAARHRAKLVNVIFDIYPDIAIDTGKVTNPLVIAAARMAERLQYWTSDLTVVLSEGFKKTLVARGVPEEKISVLPVWLDPDEILPMSRDNFWRREQGIPLDKFVVLYAGTIGVVSGASIVADAARLLHDREDILFLFVGEGEEKPKVEARARALGLHNVRFLPFQPRERLPEVQATADVGLVTLSSGRGRTSVPSKVLGYMAAGRPVIASVDLNSDTANDIAEAQAGLVVAPEDPKALAAVIRKAREDVDWRAAAGIRAREHLVKAYSRNQVLDRYRRLLGDVGGASCAESGCPVHTLSNECLRPMNARDVSAVVDIHLAAFPSFFLTALGPRFLRLYYQSILDFRQIGLVAEVAGRPIGFVTGIDNASGFYRNLLLQRGVRFAMEAGIASIRIPSAIPRLLRALTKRSPTELDQTPSVTLTSIAVLPEWRPSGAGRLLEEAFVSEARARGIKRVRLETDAEDNDRVLAFYRKCGYELRRSYSTPDCRRMHEFVKDI